MNRWSCSNIGDSLSWSRVQDKMFERALVDFPEETPDRWEKIAGKVPGKSAMEVYKHYKDLVHDVMEIDSGRVELPSYEEELDSRNQGKQRECERRKGVPWTEEEHRLFLIGLQRYGKGDWRSISRNAVVSRTPTQVASHAQKYFLRLNSIKKDKKRSSIHDITTTGTNSLGQTNDQNCVGMSVDQLTIDTLDPTSFFSGQSSSPGYQGFGFPM